MKISNSNNYGNRYKMSFGMGIYGTKATYDLINFYRGQKKSEEFISEFLDSIRKISPEDISLRIRKLYTDEKGANKIDYVITGEMTATGTNSKYYTRVKGISGINMKTILKNLNKSVETMQEKANKSHISEINSANIKKEEKLPFFKRILAKFIKIK